MTIIATTHVQLQLLQFWQVARLCVFLMIGNSASKQVMSRSHQQLPVVRQLRRPLVFALWDESRDTSDTSDASMRPFGTVLGAALPSLPQSQLKACDVRCDDTLAGWCWLELEPVLFHKEVGHAARITLLNAPPLRCLCFARLQLNLSQPDWSLLRHCPGRVCLGL